MSMFSNGVRSSIHKNISKQSLKRRIQSLHNFSVQGSPSQASYTSDNFASFLKNSCSDIDSLRKLHACIFCHGFGNSIFLGSKLVNCYAKFSLLPESRWVFDRIINDKLTLWNSILVGYFRIGHFHEVLWRYSSLRRRNIGLDSSGVTFSLKSCVELGCLGFGRGVHADGLKFGLCADPFVGSSLIGLYSKNGDIEDASKVFDELTERDVVVYTSLITGYAQIGDRRAYGAFRVARDMQKEDLDPNRVTLVSLLQAAAQVEALNEGRLIHGYAIRRGISCSDEVFETSLMDMYIKCRAPKMAASIFGPMRTRSVGSWNAAIGGNLQMGQPLEALVLFCLMVKENCAPDLITLANAVLCCANLKYPHEGKSIHGYIIRAGFQLDLVATTSLIDMYSKCNHIISGRRLFYLMEEKDVISFNVMMAGYLLNGSACEAIEVFHEMVESGIRPNLGTILSLLSTSSNLKEIKQGKSIHGYVTKYGFDLNVEIANQIIYMYAKCGCIDYAREVFCRMKYKDLVSWTSMMMGYVCHGHADKAIALFRLMQTEKLEADSVTLISLLQASAQIGCLSFAKEVHSRMYRVNMEREISVMNSLVTTYAKCGKLNLCRYLFEDTVGHSLTSWNTIIAAYGMHGDCVEVLKLFGRMKKEKVLPDEVTFTSLLSACSHSGLVEKGLHVFSSMTEEYSIIPCEEHYNCIMDLLSRAGRLEEAYDFFKSLPSRENAYALSSLLAACTVHKDTEMGVVIGMQLLDIKPKNSSAYALISNLYAEGGKWDEVARIRAMPKGRGLKWTPGYSLIELDKQASVV